MKLDDEIVELEEWDAVRVPPGTWRSYEAGSDGLELLVVGAPNLGDDSLEDVDGRRDWWADRPSPRARRDTRLRSDGSRSELVRCPTD